MIIELWVVTIEVLRGGCRTAATSKVELFVIIVNDFQPLTVITKNSTLDVAAVLDPPLVLVLRGVRSKVKSYGRRVTGVA